MEMIKQHRTFSGWTRFFKHDSSATKTPMKFSAFIPDEPSGHCLLWLSGLTCTDENFITKAGAQKIASELGLTIVCPDTSPRGLDLPGIKDSYDFGEGAGFYINATSKGYVDHFRMEDYCAQELPNLISKSFPKITSFSISGHSMGGHGALTLGLKNPDVFKKISAFSPICHPTVVPWGKKAFNLYLGADETLWENNDTVCLIKKGLKHPQTILVDQGGADEFLNSQLQPSELEKICKEKNQSLNLRIHADFDHSYYFISSFISDHLHFHSERGLNRRSLF